jgi:hypothetical protein
LAPPRGFHDRLYRRLNHGSQERIHISRRVTLAWALTAAAALPLGFALFSGKRINLLRFEHQPTPGAPASADVTGLVAISDSAGDKIFHVSSCPYLQGKPKFVPVAEAIREGYSPCPVCIGKRKPAKKG